MIFIRYYKDLIVEDNIDIIKAKELFSQGISLFNVYAICVSSKTNGLMEIMSTENLLKEVNSYGNYGIIALMKGRNKARKKSIRLIENWLVTHSDLTGFKSHYNQNSF